MSLSEPSSPRSGRLLRQVKTLKATTDELARLWKTQNKADSFDEAYAPTLRGLASISQAGESASERSLNRMASDLSKSDSMSNSLAGSVLSDLSDLLIMPSNVGDKPRRPAIKRAKSAMCVASMKYASSASKETAEGQKLTSFFGVSQEDVEFSEKYRKVMRMFGQDFPSHAALLGIIADKKRERDCDIHRPPPKLYSETDVSEDQLRQRKKLESFTGLTEEDYGNFVLQMKLFHKLGEHVPMEELRRKTRSMSLPPELEALDPNASKIERMLGARKEVIVGQDKAKKAARLLGEQIPQDYCKELAKLDNAPEKISLRKVSQPVTDAEVKQATKSVGIKKKFFKSHSKKTVGVGKKIGGSSGAKPNRGGGGGGGGDGLSIMGTGLKSAAKGKGSPSKGTLPPVKGAKTGTGKPLRR